MTDTKWIRAAQRAKTPESRRKFTRLHKALKIRTDIEGCENCDLSKTRIKTVPFDNTRPCPIAFVGEAPGAKEDETGTPFVGRSGRLLDSLIEATGNKRVDCVVLNTVACRPPRNRRPTGHESSSCRPLYDRQLEFTGAWVVVLLGGSALNQIRPNATITSSQGVPFWQQGRIYIPTFHPSYGLRKPKVQPLIKRDIALAFKIVNGSEWWEPMNVSVLATDRDKEARDLTALLDARGWAVIDSVRLQDRIVVVKDDLVKVPIKHVDLIRYNVEELVRIGELGSGQRLSTSMLHAIHLTKSLGGKVVR